MIPKIIHYCWFGGGELPELAIKCIDSWKKKCPDYEIKRWDESNFNINSCKYVKQAYQAKKWAFVSDYARFWILYNYGGIYFDTDVELIKPIDDIVKNGAFLGLEKNSYDEVFINPGLGMAAEKKMSIYREILEYYDKQSFIDKSGNFNEETVVTRVSTIMLKYGYNCSKVNKIQQIRKIYIYPEDYFCPMDYETGKLEVTKNTVSIHHYSASWHSETEKKMYEIQKFVKNKIGGKVGNIILKILLLPYKIKNKYEKEGIVGIFRKFVMTK